MKRASILLLSVLISTVSFASSNALIVHEWGTFTSLQDETGRTIGGINGDDEPLPKFVHDLLSSRDEISFGKGLPGSGSRSEVTMRLETPVMYFHLPPGAKEQMVDVSVKFRGGLLSQFYPDATTNVDKSELFPIITDQTIGTLRWNNVRIGTNGVGPATDSHVWLAPRNVDSASVTADNGESERYLFYRGVGHVDAPIVAKRDGYNLTFALRDSMNAFNSVTWRFEKLWLASFDADGSCHAVELGPLDEVANATLATPIPPDGTPGVLDLQHLRASMKTSLVAAGLYKDEAEAMLSTWEKSYFKSAGLRLFYLVPRDWTDRFLPLKVSSRAQIERVMIGRLEMVSPQQRDALGRIAGIQSISSQMKSAWDAYASMGRFRNALMLDEQARHAAPGLGQFIKLYEIR
jgi:hypothetical protein